MRKSASRSARKSRKKKSAKRSRIRRYKLVLPRMFKIVPVHSLPKAGRVARALISAEPSPCPSGTTCQGDIMWGGVAYWVCVYPDGTIVYIRKN